ncbi:MAG: 50S ribosomal protein L20 [Verrucomicrobiae bacterium]|nr:50S ribosomal protein L20 [Verrucomicrobiae bacterium]
MPRATNAPASRKRRSRMLKKAKGFRGARSKLYRTAKDAVYKAQTWAYRDRKNRKRNFRRLWIQRISAAVRELGMTYSRFTEGLTAAGIELDRKVLADIAVHDPEAFGAIVEQAKAGLDAKTTSAKSA